MFRRLYPALLSASCRVGVQELAVGIQTGAHMREGEGAGACGGSSRTGSMMAFVTESSTLSILDS